MRHRVALIAAIAVVSLAVWVTCVAQEPSSPAEHCYAGLPAAEGLVCFANTGYAVGYSDARMNPAWVAYMLFRTSRPAEAPEPPPIYPSDDRTQSGVTPEGFGEAGYTMALMAPPAAIAKCYGEMAGEETYIMSNVCPMSRTLAEQSWADLQRYILGHIVESFGETWVITGPIFGEEPEEIAHGVQVPEAFYVIILDEMDGQPRTLSYILPQDTMLGFSQLTATIDSIEALTGMDFFADADDPEAQAELEATMPPSGWRQ